MASPLPRPRHNARMRRWRHLVFNELPKVAADHEWPVTRAYRIRAVILDNVFGVPWEQVLHPGSLNARLSGGQLARAVHLAEGLASRSVPFPRLYARSEALRNRHIRPV